ncbi:MAG: hypothetical protein FJX77_10175 [Armatimonadetes bacterium]|nr:hypothetical protein [Armatimonadota bacterium]
MAVLEQTSLTLASGLGQPLRNAGAPVNGTTYANVAEVGALLLDTTNGKLYVNTGTKASPTWTVVGTQT